jgi:hypothetical protein
MKVKHILRSLSIKNQIFSIWFWFGFSIWTISFFAPYLINGLDSYIRIHDTLEGELVWLKILSDSGHLYSVSNDVKLYNLMYGLPRNVLPSGFTFVPNMIHYFGMFWGYIFAHYILKTMGFVSFYIFIKKYMTLPSLNEVYIVSVCLLLTSIQFFTPFGLSIVGMPILALAFARLYYQKGIKTTLLIFFMFPFFSSFVWSGIELIILFGMLLLWMIFKQKDQFVSWFLSALAFGFGTLIANIQFFNGMLFSEGFRSHRVLYNTLTDMPNFSRTLSDFFGFLFSLHYHVSIFISIIIVIVFLISYFFVEKNPWAKRIFLFIVSIVAWQAFYPFFEFILKDITFIKSFHFNRFGFLLPFLWLILLLVSIEILSKNIILKKTIPLILISQFLVLALANDETAHNYKKIFKRDNFPSYKQYLALDIFPKIIKENNIKPHEKTISIAMSPSIAQYHGLSTLDGLFSVYDLDFKLEFQKIFQKELDKTDWKRREYFTNWGNRCYVFPADLPIETVANTMASKDRLKIKNLELDINQLKKMGCKYLFSAAEIINCKEIGLTYIKAYQSENLFWKIYLYEV